RTVDSPDGRTDRNALSRIRFAGDSGLLPGLAGAHLRLSSWLCGPSGTGMLWPQSVYGVMSAPIWRSLEHAGWVIFEVTFLIISIRKSLREMLVSAERQAKLDSLNRDIEYKVTERTEELTPENLE